MYEKYFKRCLDLVFSVLALLALSPLLLLLSILGAIFMKGNPFYIQRRPGKDEALFPLIKFRSMTRAQDSAGNDLPDKQRLTPYGHFIRATSLDELPELLNIFLGHMSFVGPRPQLVRDMVFMTPQQRKRHRVRPGLTGLAQISGRNALLWENKLALDLRYLEKISFIGDLKILLKTAKIMLLGGDAGDAETECTDDFGDYLLKNGSIDEHEYKEKQEEAKVLLTV